MEISKCKVCDRKPKIELHPDGDKVLISCVDDQHYIAMEYPSEKVASEQWDKLMSNETMQ